MNKIIWMALGAVALVVTVAAVGGAATAGVEMQADRYPSVQRDVSEQVDLGFVSSGIIRETGAYRTGDDPRTVAAWYQFRDHLQPTRGLQQGDACTRLEKEEHYPVARLTLVVSLCPAGQDTEVSFSHTLTLGQ